MNWSEFWVQFENIVIWFQGLIAVLPVMLLDVIFAGLTFGAVWILVKMIREVRS